MKFCVPSDRNAREGPRRHELEKMMFRAAGSGREFEFVMFKLIFLRAFLLFPDEEHVSRCLSKVYHWEQIRSVMIMHDNKGYETSIRPYVKPDDLQRVADTLIL